jgi:predicted PurR-regulated permease PerM
MVVNQRLQALAYGALLAAILGWVLHIGKDVFVPVAFGVVVVYIVSGLANLLSRLPVLASVLTTRVRYVLSVLAIAAALAFFASLVIATIGQFVENATEYQAAVMRMIQNVGVRFGVETEPTWTSVREYVVQRISVSQLLGSTAAVILSIAASVVLVFLYAAFLLIEQSALAGKIDRLSKDSDGAQRIRRIISSINARIGRYLALKTVLGIVVGALSLIVMKVMGLEFAAFLALLIALLNYIPYIGSVLSVIFPVIVAIVQFGDFNVVLLVLVLLSALQFVNGNLLDPYLMGNSLNLSPFVIVLSLAVSTALWGVPGALLAVPFAAILVIVFSESEATRPIAILLSRDGRLSGDEG